MKNPHDKSEYVNITTEDAPADATDSAAAETSEDLPREKNKKQPKYSGAYYYVDKDEEKLASASFARTTLTIIAFLLQIVSLFFPEQAGTTYVADHIASYGLFYVLFTIFGMFCVSVWLMFMNQLKYKIAKRIPMENAPKTGFKRRTYFGLELYVAVFAVMAAFQLSFVCIRFDGWGLGAFFVCLAALASAVAARQIAYLTLRDAEFIPAPTEDKEPDEPAAE